MHQQTAKLSWTRAVPELKFDIIKNSKCFTWFYPIICWNAHCTLNKEHFYRSWNHKQIPRNCLLDIHFNMSTMAHLLYHGHGWISWQQSTPARLTKGLLPHISCEVDLHNANYNQQYNDHCSYYEETLPIQPAFAVTGHSAQGKTLPSVLVNLHEEGFAAYVAASRAWKHDGLCITEKVSLDELN